MSDDTETDHQDAADPGEHDDDGSEAFYGGTCKMLVQGDDAECQGWDEHHPSEDCDELHRCAGKRGDITERVFQKAPKAPFGGTDRPILYLEGNLYGAKAYPGG